MSLPPEDERRRYKEEVRSGIEVLYLRAGSAITVSGFWEFVPYNDASLAGKVSKSFKASVEKLRYDLLNEPDPDDKTLALYGLKKSYIKTFGFGSEERNMISLFLYTGPINRAPIGAAAQVTSTGTDGTITCVEPVASATRLVQCCIPETGT